MTNIVEKFKKDTQELLTIIKKCQKQEMIMKERSPEFNGNNEFFNLLNKLIEELCEFMDDKSRNKKSFLSFYINLNDVVAVVKYLSLFGYKYSETDAINLILELIKININALHQLPDDDTKFVCIETVDNHNFKIISNEKAKQFLKKIGKGKFNLTDYEEYGLTLEEAEELQEFFENNDKDDYSKNVIESYKIIRDSYFDNIDNYSKDDVYKLIKALSSFDLDESIINSIKKHLLTKIEKRENGQDNNSYYVDSQLHQDKNINEYLKNLDLIILHSKNICEFKLSMVVHKKGIIAQPAKQDEIDNLNKIIPKYQEIFDFLTMPYEMLENANPIFDLNLVMFSIEYNTVSFKERHKFNIVMEILKRDLVAIKNTNPEYRIGLIKIFEHYFKKTDEYTKEDIEIIIDVLNSFGLEEEYQNTFRAILLHQLNKRNSKKDNTLTVENRPVVYSTGKLPSKEFNILNQKLKNYIDLDNLTPLRYLKLFEMIEITKIYSSMRLEKQTILDNLKKIEKQNRLLEQDIVKRYLDIKPRLIYYASNNQELTEIIEYNDLILDELPKSNNLDKIEYLEQLKNNISEFDLNTYSFEFEFSQLELKQKESHKLKK